MFTGHPAVPTFEDIQRVLLGWYDATAAADATNATHASTAAQASGQTAQERTGQQPLPAAASAPPGGTAAADSASNYSLTITGSAATHTHKLEPQLAAVVVVLAAHSRCSPDTLLDCVKALEKQMVSVEAGVRILKQLHTTTGGSRSQQQPGTVDMES